MTAPHPDYACIALVDLSYLFTRNYRGAGVKAPPNEGANRTLHDLAAIRDDVDHVILCLDGPPYLRRDRFEAYKAHREEPPPEEVAQKRALIEELKRLGYVAARVRGYEADDIIATLSRIYAEWCPEIRIYGPDKDVAQCIRANVVQISPSSGKRQAFRRDAKRCHEDFGALPSQMAFYQALVGDGTDGIPGVKGIGPVAAKAIITELVGAGRPVTLESLANHIGETKPEGKPWSLLTAGWNNLKLSLDLTVLDPNVPLDANALLLKRAPEPNAPDEGDVDLFGFEGNHTPPAPPLDAFETALDAFEPDAPLPRVGADPNAQAVLLEQAIARGDEFIRTAVCPDGYSPTAERGLFKRNVYAPGTPSASSVGVATDAAIASGKQPETVPETPEHRAAAAAAAAPTPPPAPPANDTPPPAAAPPPGLTVLGTGRNQVSATAIAKAAELGMVNTRLQPLDLTGAFTLAKWLFGSGRYGNHDTIQGLFAVIHRGVELGLDVGTALAGFHIIKGKPSMSADLIRALAKKHPDCEYFYEESSDATHSTWVTRNRKHPPGVIQRMTYTIEEAMQVPDLWKRDHHGGPSMWEKRPKQMLSKTCSSILARREYEESTLGMYCPEEMGMVITTTGVAA